MQALDVLLEQYFPVSGWLGQRTGLRYFMGAAAITVHWNYTLMRFFAGASGATFWLRTPAACILIGAAAITAHWSYTLMRSFIGAAGATFVTNQFGAQ
eukprot:5999975-Lingulodinium_polyedra.AAC.1